MVCGGQDIWCHVIQVRCVTRILFVFLFGLVKSHVDERPTVGARRWE